MRRPNRHRVEVELERRHGLVEIPLRGDERMDLADPPGSLAIGEDVRRPARMQERLAAGGNGPWHSQRVEQPGEDAFDREEVDRRRVPVAPGGGRAGPISTAPTW